MDNIINLSKKFYNKNQYEKVIDTNFSQLVQDTSSLEETPSISIDQFFQYYQSLFYSIPKFGEINSHEYIVNNSSAYIGTTESQNEELQALINEITSLKQENLELNKQIITLQISSSING